MLLMKNFKGCSGVNQFCVMADYSIQRDLGNVYTFVIVVRQKGSIKADVELRVV